MRLLLTPSYAKTATPLEAASTSDTVDYEITVTNTGLLKIFDISVTAWGDGAGISGALTCIDVNNAQVASDDTEDVRLSVSTHESLQVQGLASYPDSGLPGGGSLTCTFSSAVDQTEVSSSRGCRPYQVADTNVSAQLAFEAPSRRSCPSFFLYDIFMLATPGVVFVAGNASQASQRCLVAS